MDFLKSNKILIFLLFLAGVFLFFSVGHYSTFFLDVGREMYYPYAILKGAVLYKDIFCIYGPFSYLFNAFLYKILGIKLSSLYFGGVVSAFLTVILTYLISKKFLNTFLSTSITFFVLTTGCLATRIFNLTLPYSYAVVYGLVCFLVSIYFLISFIEDKKDFNLIISSVFASFAIANKYDFILFLVPLLFVILKTKNLKLILKSFLALFLPIVLTFLILFLQGLKIKDLIEAFFLVKSFVNTEALKIFYSTQGVYYSSKLWGDWLLTLLNRGFCLIIIYFSWCLIEKQKKLFKILGFILLSIGALITAFSTKETSYLWLTFFVFIFLIFTFLKNGFKENIFIISSLLVASKSFWGLSHVNYGLYYIPFILISFFILLKLFQNKISKSFAVLLISMALAFGVMNLFELSFLNEKINTDKGYLKTSFSQAKITNSILSFADELSEKETLAVFPEGLNINFLSKNTNIAPLKYNSLIPLYTEGFGEDRIIEHYKIEKPDYVIFVKIPMTSYGKDFICKSYGMEFCGFIEKNYKEIKQDLELKDIFKIYKRAHI